MWNRQARGLAGIRLFLAGILLISLPPLLAGSSDSPTSNDGVILQTGGSDAAAESLSALPNLLESRESLQRRQLLESGAGGNAIRQGKMLVDQDGGSGDWQSGGPLSLGVGLFDGFLTSLSMILVSEIGDETFIIAALMAMRHPRGVVLAGALSALAIMTVLSTGLGFIVPNLISRKATNSAATVLYTFFGLRLLYIAWKADPNDTPQKEMEEVEEKLEDASSPSDGKGKDRSVRTVRRVLSRFCTPVFLEAFILTFLAEWGDRSQIATIALAAHKNPFGVTIGATLGHTICTSIAVVGGRLLALKISQRTVATVGGLLFLVFAVHSFFTPPL
eukprot:TRINITY_DN2073_c0_g1_i1.p1 TRINITY_DN2073_c0_g1~~TRINITY_DN2073_c0_g1_i1.p1  ORF type:complete len:333 (+),score=58.26 TRINITY_DN2073_c0_g1_i1:440-1438(+)